MNRKLRMGMVGGGTDAFIGAIHRLAAFMDGQIELVCGCFSINPEISIEKARNSIHELLNSLKTQAIGDEELQKLKNKSESNLVFSESSIMGKAMSLGYYDYLGNTDLINDEIELYYKITSDDIIRVSNIIFTPENEVELVYLPDLS